MYGSRARLPDCLGSNPDLAAGDKETTVKTKTDCKVSPQSEFPMGTMRLIKPTEDHTDD